ncbi:MAG: type II toxin-antitoxin system RelE/ParE family toxin [Acidobacteria bacterium]|nr:type II toxin-antitoxin system RelE/ParE family toxin [Acidobacteriota bacterium]MCW5970640.1 type II toxin-antitoxin system RelE/ParE family toxin [Blastocatellales bacterium]
MTDFIVTFPRSARKELEGLPAQIIQRIFPRVDALAGDPRPKGCRKLQGEKHLWRIRIGDYRVCNR